MGGDIMFNVMGIVVPLIAIFVVCLFVYGFIAYAKWGSKRMKETKAFDAMLRNPSDAAVYEYIPLFLESCKVPIIRPGNDNEYRYTGVLYESKLRQSQGYQIIIQSPNVSDKAKEDLKRAFISQGVIPIQ